MAQMIVLIQESTDKVFIQLNRHDDLETFTIHLEFTHAPGRAEIKRFTLPCLSSDYGFSVYGDRYTKTINQVTKALPKLLENSEGLTTFIQKLGKKYKVDAYQINVNSCFDDSMVKPFNLEAVVDIVTTLDKKGFGIRF